MGKVLIHGMLPRKARAAALGASFKETRMRSKLAIGGVTVAVAFLLATNPVVVNAAGQITGAQIKNSTIKGKDVKNNSLTGKDVKEATLVGVDAATLNGQPGAAYLSTGYKFPLPITAPSTEKTFTLPVPAGTYHASYNAILTSTAGPRC